MNAEEIAKPCEFMSLSKEDGPVVQIPGEFHVEYVKNMTHCLIGRILSRRMVNRDAFKAVLEHIWNTVHGVEIEMASCLKLTPHVRPKVNGPRKFSTNRDNAYSDFPRYHDGKFGSGKWEDNLGSGRRKSSSSEDNPVTISVKHVEEGVKGVVCNNNISSLLVGLDSVREENVKKGVMVPYVCIDSGMFHFVEDFGKVTDNVEGLNSIMGCQKKVSKHWKRVARSPTQKHLVGLPSPIKKFFTARARNRYNSRSPKQTFLDKNNDGCVISGLEECKKGKRNFKSAEEILSSAYNLVQDFQHSLASLVFSLV
ncbi:hypothetical protein ACOSP7_009561 [Xanthoceras sorbifolium]